MVICLGQGANLPMVQQMPLPITISCPKSRLVLPFWYQLIRVVLDKGLLNGCCCCCCSYFTYQMVQMSVKALTGTESTDYNPRRPPIGLILP